MSAENYIPPLRYKLLTRFYDPIVRWTTRETAFKGALLAQVVKDRPRHVLDLGCGTVQLLDGFETTRDPVSGALPELLRAAGYDRVEGTAKFDAPLGTMRLLRAA
jgi:hypothetical protein